MTPDEHYTKAEQLLAAAANTYSRTPEACALDAQLGIGHALLANCGLRANGDRAWQRKA